MKRLNITSSDGGKYWLEKTDAEAQEYIDWAARTAKWGKPAWVETRIVESEIRDEVTGEVITPARTEEISHPAEYSIEVVDITAEIEAKEKSKKDKEALALEVEALKNKSGAWTTAELTKAMKLLLAK